MGTSTSGIYSQNKVGKSLLILILLFTFLTGTVISQGTKHKFPYLIVQITDPQFGFFDNNRSFGKETELYEKAVRAVNRISPDLVVITGDFVNDKSDTAQWKEFNRITDEIDSSILVRLTPGNHDIGLPPAWTDIDRYLGMYGYDRFSLRYRHCLLIGINTVIIKSQENDLEQDQLQWLKNELAKHRRVRHKIIFSHYPFFIKSLDEPESYSNIGVDERTKYLNLFRDFHVSAVFSGHLHNNASSSSGKTEMTVTSAVGKPLDSAPSGIRMIIVYRNRIENSYFPLNEIPDSIMFTK